MIVSLRLCNDVNCQLAFNVYRRCKAFNDQDVVIGRISLYVVQDFMRSFFLSNVTSRCLYVRRRAAANKDVGPARIRGQFQFTNAGRVPFTVCPNFCPYVIIINVYPAQDVCLSYQGACQTRDYCNRNKFFAATAVDNFCKDR